MSRRTERKPRATQLDVDDVRRLDHFATSLDVMFPANVGVLHVGSSLWNPDFRDVDVRVVLHDKDYRRLAKRVNTLDLNMLLSGWGRQVTGLRIDCQVQSASESGTYERTNENAPHGLGQMARHRRPLDKVLDQ